MIKGETTAIKTVDRFCKVCNTITEQEKMEEKIGRKTIEYYFCLNCYFGSDSNFKEEK